MVTKRLKILDVYFSVNENYSVRTETLNGKPHIVVPVVMMVEGVHSGSHGPILHLAEELGKYPESWDGIPVTIGHPLVNGQYVSANNPEVLQNWAVGRIFNTHMSGTALTAEAWLEEESLQRVSSDTLERLNANEIIEVSIGIFSDEEPVAGIWNTERYTRIARNHRPNHLALLPDEVGACSIADGCGIRVNKREKTNNVMHEKISINSENRDTVIKELNRMGFSVNEMGFGEIREKVAQSIYGLDGNGLDHYVEEIYSDYFVYTQFNHRVDPRKRSLFKQTYSIDASGEVKLSGDPVSVKKEISYAPVQPQVNTEVRVKTERLNKKSNTMCTECVKRLADGLINNKSTAWSEADRPFLESQSEEYLEKMTPQSVEQPQVNKLTRESVLEVFKQQPMSNDEFLSLASTEVRLQIQEGLELRTNQKNTIVTEILANSEVWTEDELKLKELPELQKIHKLATKDLGETVYVGAGGLGGKTEIKNNSKRPAPIGMLKSVVKN